MNTQALLTEILLSGFFAVACFRARGESVDDWKIAPHRMFALTDRIERLRRSRWQWFAMVLLMFVMRQERGAPMIAEVTVVVQFILFLLLPTQKENRLMQKSLRAASRKA